jgi:predicted RNA-binding protein associated with RNAse of E/G family
LDLWVSPDGSYQIEDEDEFESAIANNWIQTDLANQARNALQDLIAEIESGAFPPEITDRW